MSCREWAILVEKGGDCGENGRQKLSAKITTVAYILVTTVVY